MDQTKLYWMGWIRRSCIGWDGSDEVVLDGMDQTKLYWMGWIRRSCIGWDGSDEVVLENIKDMKFYVQTSTKSPLEARSSASSHPCP